MSDEITNLLSEIAPDLKDAPAPSENKNSGANEAEVEADETELDDGGEGEEEIDFDNATPEQQKEWPKTFKNALSKAKKERVKAIADKRVLEDRLAVLERNQQQPPKKEDDPVEKPGEPQVSKEMKVLLDKKPALKDFQDWGSYNEALIKWNTSVAKQELKEEGSVERKKEKEADAEAASVEQQRTAIVKKTKELLDEFPQLSTVLQANQEYLKNVPEHVAKAFRESENAAIAFAVLVGNEGALEALSKMSPLKAAQYIGQAEYIGLQQLRAAREQKANADGGSGADGAETKGKDGKRVSSAPAPMRTAKGGTSGSKALDNMTADELAKSKEFADVFK